MKLTCSHCLKELNVPEPLVPEEVVRGESGFICDACYGPDWQGACTSCGSGPTVPATGLCGPCTWNDPSTAGGNW